MHSAKALVAVELKRALSESLSLQSQGGFHAKVSKAQGFVDGYMRAVLDAKIMTQDEMLKLVAEVRSQARGPATVELPTERFAFTRAIA